MRKIHDLKTGEKAIVFTIIIPAISALVVFLNYTIPEEHLITLIKTLFSILYLIAIWRVLDLFIFNDKNKETEDNNAQKKKKKK